MGDSIEEIVRQKKREKKQEKEKTFKSVTLKSAAIGVRNSVE